MTSQSSIENDLNPCGCATPGASDAESCYCGVEDLLRIIRRRYSLLVLRAIRAQQGARYRDLAAALPSASTSTLAETLRALEAARLIARGGSADSLAAPGYSLTASGEKLLSRLRRLLEEVQET